VKTGIQDKEKGGQSEEKCERILCVCIGKPSVGYPLPEQRDFRWSQGAGTRGFTQSAQSEEKHAKKIKNNEG